MSERASELPAPRLPGRRRGHGGAVAGRSEPRGRPAERPALPPAPCPPKPRGQARGRLRGGSLARRDPGTWGRALDAPLPVRKFRRPAGHLLPPRAPAAGPCEGAPEQPEVLLRARCWQRPLRTAWRSPARRPLARRGTGKPRTERPRPSQWRAVALRSAPWARRLRCGDPRGAPALRAQKGDGGGASSAASLWAASSWSWDCAVVPPLPTSRPDPDPLEKLVGSGDCQEEGGLQGRRAGRQARGSLLQ